MGCQHAEYSLCGYCTVIVKILHSYCLLRAPMRDDEQHFELKYPVCRILNTCFAQETRRKKKTHLDKMMMTGTCTKK